MASINRIVEQMNLTNLCTFYLFEAAKVAIYFGIKCKLRQESYRFRIKVSGWRNRVLLPVYYGTESLLSFPETCGE